MAKRKPKLTELQRRYCDILFSMKKPNQAAAYKKAGFKCKGKSCEVMAHRLLKKGIVAKYYKGLQEKASERAEKSADEIIAELEKVGFVDINNLFDDTGALKDIKDIPEDTRRAIAGIDIVEEFEGKGKGKKKIGYAKKIKIYDKVKALENLGKRFGIFPNKIEGNIAVIGINFIENRRTPKSIKKRNAKKQ